jgi:hypothetical protein
MIVLAENSERVESANPSIIWSTENYLQRVGLYEYKNDGHFDPRLLGHGSELISSSTILVVECIASDSRSCLPAFKQHSTNHHALVAEVGSSLPVVALIS